MDGGLISLDTKYSKRLIIFEGPDGAGKTTLARRLANDIGARYVHLGPFPRVKTGLARLYIEAMLPALLGYEDTVMDRCWYSEVPYGIAYRGGVDRIEIRSRILERMAMRCETSLVWCVPPWGRVHDNFIARKGDEYLQNTQQLKTVYDWYNDACPGLPAIYANPFEAAEGSDFVEWLKDEIDLTKTTPHPLNKSTSGMLDAKVVLVGDNFSDPAEGDPLYQSPFSSFAPSSSSMWLARQLEAAGIEEKHLFWVNSDNFDEVPEGRHIVALGTVAGEKLFSLGCKNFNFVQHPQAWRRFRSHQAYELIPVLKGLLENG